MTTNRIDELLAQMTPEEKAGQLIQYFYFSLPSGAVADPALGLDVRAQPTMVEAAVGQGGAGALLFVTDPAEINRLQRLAVEDPIVESQPPEDMVSRVVVNLVEASSQRLLASMVSIDDERA